MTTPSHHLPSKSKPPTFHLWMISNFGIGACIGAFINILVPPFITQITGSALRVGIIMGVVSLAAISGPFWGKLADKHHLHKPIYIGSLIAISLSFLILIADSIAAVYSPIFGLIVGLAISAQGTIGSGLIVGSRNSKDTIADQLTTYSLLMPLGQVIGSLLVFSGELLGFGYGIQFLTACIFLSLITLLTALNINQPIKNLALSQSPTSPVTPSLKKSSKTKSSAVHLHATIFSAFTFFILTTIFSSMANNAVQGQAANILPQVYGFTSLQTSLVIGLAGFLNLGTILLSGYWLKKSSALTVFAGGTTLRLIGYLAMAAVGFLTNSPHLILATIAIQIAFQATVIPRLVSPELTFQLSSTNNPSQANGYYYAASSFGSFIGCLLAGFLADYFQNYNTISIMATIVSIIAMFTLWGIYLGRKSKSLYA